MKKILITAITLMGLLLTANTAGAAPVQGEVKVAVYGHGKLVADGIECGSGATDCSETVAWDDAGPAPSLSLNPLATKAGWSITSWSGCSSLPSMNDCRVTVPASGTRTVTAHFFDIAPPRVFIAGYSSGAGDSLHVNLDVTDNEKITKVEFLLDDEVVLTQTENFGDATIDTREVPEGDRVLKARAWDGNRNMGESNAHTIQVDHTPPQVILDDPVTATNQETVAFTFENPAGDIWSADCTIRRAGETGEFDWCGDSEPFTAVVPSEGGWEFVIEARDMVGNESRIVHPFTVDRTAPTAAFTSGPADGSTVAPGPVEFTWDVSDDLPVAQTCEWDGQSGESCDGLATRNLEPGVHAFSVRVVDLAGNSVTLHRQIRVARDEEPGPDPTPDPDPVDGTPPAVKLTVPKQKLTSMKRALRVNVRCNEACSGKVLVKGRGIRFGARVRLERSGVARLKLRPGPKLRKRLTAITARGLRERGSRPLRLVATAAVRDMAGNAARARLKFRVRA